MGLLLRAAAMGLGLMGQKVLGGDIADVLQFLLDGMLVMNVENMHTDCITSSHLDLDLFKP